MLQLPEQLDVPADKGSGKVICRLVLQSPEGTQTAFHTVLCALVLNLIGLDHAS